VGRQLDIFRLWGDFAGVEFSSFHFAFLDDDFDFDGVVAAMRFIQIEYSGVSRPRLI